MRYLLLLACLGTGLKMRGAVIFEDDFSYTNGILQTVSQQKWVGHSGATNEVDVTNGRVNLTGSESQDVNTLLPGQPFQTNSSTVLYARFKINFSALPSGNGSYFAHFKDSGSGFRGRIWALAANALAGHFHLGLTSESASPADPVATNELALNSDYTVVLRLGVSNALATLWIDPQNESAPSISTTSGKPINVAAFALRQSSGMGTLTFDELRIGTQFSDVITPVPLSIITQPANQTIIAGASATFSVTAIGPASLTYQWQLNGNDIRDATNATMMLPTPTAGEYSVVIHDGTSSISSEKAILTVLTGDAPSISIQPQDRSVKLETAVAFYVSAVGTAPLTYQWLFNGAPLANATNVFYTVLSTKLTDAGPYSVIVRNPFGSVTSDSALLTIELPPPLTVSTNIGYLRGLVDSINYLPPITGNLFTVQGVVTTFTNMTSAPDLLFFIQDATAGIAVYATNGFGLLPMAGDLVTVTAPLTDNQGLLELGLDAANSLHQISVLSSGGILPIPMELNLALQHDPAAIDAQEGKLVIISNVVLNLSPANFGTNGDEVALTNRAGETMNLHVEKGSNLAGQRKPSGMVSIIGILAQFDTTNPRTSGYEIIPRSLGDIILPPLPPAIVFTNVLQNLIRPGDAPTNIFAENSVHPGETLTMNVRIDDPARLNLHVFIETNGMPASAHWSLDSGVIGSALATLVFTPGVSDRGSNYIFFLAADNGQTTNSFRWEIYVPTVLEENLVLSEFLANPTSSATTPLFNPLKRIIPAPHPASDDEFVELVDRSPLAIDLGGWTIFDSVRVRHRFSVPFLVASSNAIVVYGGPLTGFEPSPDIPAVPASEGTSGLGLNNSGDSIIIRNATSNLVSRTVYLNLPSNSSLTRAPDLNGGFVAHSSVSTNVVSPGRNFNGQPFLITALPEVTAINLSASFAQAGSIALKWNTQAGLTYSVQQSATVDGLYHVVEAGLIIGLFSVQYGSALDPAFYRISSP